MKALEQLKTSTQDWLRLRVGMQARELVRLTLDAEYANATKALQTIIHSGGSVLLTVEDESHPSKNRSDLMKANAGMTIDNIGLLASQYSFVYTISIRNSKGEELTSIHYPRPRGIADEINDHLYFE